MRLGFGASWIAAALLACGYDFGGTDGDTSSSGGRGGAANGSSRVSSPAASTSDTTTASAVTSTVDASSSNSEVTASSGTVAPMTPCNDTLGDAFVDAFDLDNDGRWSKVAPNGMTSEARIFGGKAELKQGDAAWIELLSARKLTFVECSIEVQHLKRVANFDGIRLEIGQETFLELYDLDQKWYAYFKNPGSTSLGDMPYGPWVRFRAAADMVYMESSADGVTYAGSIAVPRATLPFLDQSPSLAFRIDGTPGSLDPSEWDNLNTMP